MKSPRNKALLMHQPGGDILAVIPQFKTVAGKDPKAKDHLNLNYMPQSNNFFICLNFLNLGVTSIAELIKNKAQTLKYLKCKVPFLLLILLPFFVQSQNLVPNPSFEEYLECPYGTAEFHNQVIDWYSWQESPDFFHTCSNDLEGFAGVPNNAWGNQWPILGEAYAGVITYAHWNTSLREYMSCSLVEEMEIGESYYVMFYASFYDGGEISYAHCATNRLGLKLFKDPPLYTPEVWNNPYTPQNTADIEYNEWFVDSVNWVLIDGWVKADDAYNWLAIGNFYDTDHTDTLQLGDINQCLAIYYIENVCISKNSVDCDYLKQPQDISSSVEKKDFIIQIFPNPSAGSFQVTFSNVPNEIEVFNSVGQSIFISSRISNSLTIDGNKWAKGLYILVVKGDGGEHQSFKLIKQ